MSDTPEPSREARLTQIRAREQQATKGPWENRVFYASAGVNDGTIPDWSNHRIPHGQCAFCHHADTLVKAFTDADGRSMHMHRFATADEQDWWPRIYATDGTEITGPFDHANGGVCSTQADADFIASSRADIPWLLDQLAARDAQLQQIREAVRRIADYPDAEMFLSLAPAVEMKRLARLALLSEEP